MCNHGLLEGECSLLASMIDPLAHTYLPSASASASAFISVLDAKSGATRHTLEATTLPEANSLDTSPACAEWRTTNRQATQLITCATSSPHSSSSYCKIPSACFGTRDPPRHVSGVPVRVSRLDSLLSRLGAQPPRVYPARPVSSILQPPPSGPHLGAADPILSQA